MAILRYLTTLFTYDLTVHHIFFEVCSPRISPICLQFLIVGEILPTAQGRSQITRDVSHHNPYKKQYCLSLSYPRLNSLVHLSPVSTSRTGQSFCQATYLYSTEAASCTTCQPTSPLIPHDQTSSRVVGIHIYPLPPNSGSTTIRAGLKAPPYHPTSKL
jgi:hypothetical protein